MRFADSRVLCNGKIAIHFAGMVQYPDGSLAEFIAPPARIRGKRLSVWDYKVKR
jgi:hypothetical protein